MNAAGLRIGYIAHQFPPEVGAGAARVSEMALRWASHGAEVTVITGMPNRPEGRIHPEYRGKLFCEESYHGVRVLRSWLHARPGGGFATTLANNLSFMLTGGARAVARAGKLDVLIASCPPFFVHPAGEAARALRRVPLVAELRDLWPDYLLGMGVLRPGIAARALFAVERHLLRRADHTIVVTESFRRRVMEKGVAAERVDVISNGIDPSLYYPADEPPPVPELERRGDEMIFGYLGNFGAGQRLEAIVEAAKRLEDTPRIRFVLAGGGTERSKVEERVRELAPSNLTLLPPVAKDRTRSFYNACDVCLVPLADAPVFQETVPSKLFEVMACGRPVLASLAGEAAAIVHQSGGGSTCAPGDPQAIRAAVLHLADRPPGELALMGQRGREFVTEHFDRSVLADRYLGILLRMAGEKPGAARDRGHPVALPD